MKDAANSGEALASAADFVEKDVVAARQATATFVSFGAKDAGTSLKPRHLWLMLSRRILSTL